MGSFLYLLVLYILNGTYEDTKYLGGQDFLGNLDLWYNFVGCMLLPTEEIYTTSTGICQDSRDALLTSSISISSGCCWTGVWSICVASRPWSCISWHGGEIPPPTWSWLFISVCEGAVPSSPWFSPWSTLAGQEPWLDIIYDNYAFSSSSCTIFLFNSNIRSLGLVGRCQLQSLLMLPLYKEFPSQPKSVEYFQLSENQEHNQDIEKRAYETHPEKVEIWPLQQFEDKSSVFWLQRLCHPYLANQKPYP